MSFESKIKMQVYRMLDIFNLLDNFSFPVSQHLKIIF